MLRVCLPRQYESSIYHTNTKFDTSYIFSQTELPRQIDALPGYRHKISFLRSQRSIAQFKIQTESQ